MMWRASLSLVTVVLFCGLATGATGPVEAWIAHYDGPANDSDEPFALAVYDSCCVYVTGGGTVSGPAQDYVTIKYTVDSNIPVWVASYNGPGNFRDVAYDIALDNSGNVYVTGVSDGVTPDGDYATIKYAPDSNAAVWVARYDGPGNLFDDAQGVAVDGSGNVYVTGASRGSVNWDYATIKYTASSNIPVWVARYDGPGNDWDFARSIAVDDSCNVYVTGETFNGTDLDYATVKYTVDSNIPVWVAIYDGPADSNDDIAYDIAVDNSGNIYVTGASEGNDTGMDCTTIKYAPDSNIPVWVARYNGPANSFDQGNALAIDSSGNIYVTGESDSNTTSMDYITIKYGPDSNVPVWVARYDGPSSDHDAAYGIDLDRVGNVYVTGSSGGSTDMDYATIKYGPDSNTPLWVARYDEGSDNAWAIGLDDSNNVYVTGSVRVDGSWPDIVTIKYVQTSCTSPINGDLNDDCKVDFFDLALLVSNWLECNLEPPSACWE